MRFVLLLVLEKMILLFDQKDEEKNNQTVCRKGIEGVITTVESKIPVYVLGTDEELMIARDTFELSQNS